MYPKSTPHTLNSVHADRGSEHIRQTNCIVLYAMYLCISLFLLQFLSLDGYSLSPDDLVRLGKGEFKIKVGSTLRM